jgi:hypothetical protein
VLDEPCLFASRQVRRFVEGREGDPEHRRAFAQPFEQLPAGPIGQTEVANQNIESNRRCELESRAHVAREMHAVASGFEKTLQRPRGGGVVFDHKDANR